jgi:hypothetical protein
MIPVVAEDPAAPSALPTADSYTWFTETAAQRAPSWRNEVTLRTIEYGFGYEPGAYIGLISPTPLLLIVAVKDHLAVSDLAIAAYAHANEPKRLVLLTGVPPRGGLRPDSACSVDGDDHASGVGTGEQRRERIGCALEPVHRGVERLDRAVAQ